MERRRPPLSRKTDRRISQDSAGENPPLSLPYLSKLIDYGRMTIGQIPPAGTVAVVGEGPHTYVMLRRRDGETLSQLLIRLDQTFARVIHDGVFTDEINEPR